MIGIERPTIECVELSQDGSYGRFEVEPLERGYGITLGNSLRRILLSSLPGVAVSAIKIDGERAYKLARRLEKNREMVIARKAFSPRLDPGEAKQSSDDSQTGLPRQTSLPRNDEIKMPSREVEIYELELLRYQWPQLEIRAHVSSGTYIRTLAEDIGKALKTSAYTEKLRRIKIGKYDVKNAQALDEFTE